MADKSKGPGRDSDKVSSSPDTEPKKRLSLTLKLFHLERGDHWKRADTKLRLSGPQQESIVIEHKRDHSREEAEQRERLMRDEEDRRLAHEYRMSQLPRKWRD